MSITEKARKKLWAKSGNRCAISKIKLVIDPIGVDDESVIGDECHIHARNPNGPRYNPDITDEEIDDYENLILLSKNYHKTVDDKPWYYTVEKLKDIKRKHENWVNKTLDFASQHASPELNEILRTIPYYLYPFRKTDIWRIGTYRSSLHNRTYGTVDTEYAIIDQDLIGKVKEVMNSDHFFLIYGNSGRGKTFFSLYLMESIIDRYDVVLYYSPHFHSIGHQDIDSILNPIQKICSTGSRLLLVLDDGHLVPNQLKHKLLIEIQNPEIDYLHLLLISRQQEDEITGLSHSKDELMLNFNEVAEQTFNQILNEFSKKNNLNISNQMESEIRNKIKGPNLVFLTHILRSWERLLEKNKNEDLSINRIFKNAYENFLDYYEGSHHTEGWKYINHIVSALFQYEIRIDKNYLTPEYNRDLANYGLEEYLRDCMIHKKQLNEGDKKRLFYVFMDFVKGEQRNAMRHASEFSFYLEAYQDNLSFMNKRGLDRKEFTMLVLQDYIRFGPINVPEVEDRIQKNAEMSEKEYLLRSLYNDSRTASVMDEETLKLLNNNLDSIR